MGVLPSSYCLFAEHGQHALGHGKAAKHVDGGEYQCK
jgi:hypothetical protein